MNEIPTQLMEAAIYYKVNQRSTSLAKASRKFHVSIKRLRTQIKKLDRGEQPLLQIRAYPSPEVSNSENSSSMPPEELPERSFYQKILDDDVLLREIKAWARKMMNINDAQVEEVTMARQKIGDLEMQVEKSRVSQQELFFRDKEISRLNSHIEALRKDYEVLKCENGKLALEAKGCAEIECLKAENEKLTQQVLRVKRLFQE